jgi:hypothetical protein
VLAVPACAHLLRSPHCVVGKHVGGTRKPVEQTSFGVVAQASSEKGLVRKGAFVHNDLQLVPSYNNGVLHPMSRSFV